MKTFVISAIVATMAATSSFAAVGDTVSNGYDKTLEVIQQQTGSSGNTRVVLLNDAGQERKFTVRKNGKVRGKGGKKLKANIAAMVADDLAASAPAPTTSANNGGGKGYNMVDCNLVNGVDRIAAISHSVIKQGIKAQRDHLAMVCAQ